LYFDFLCAKQVQGSPVSPENLKYSSEICVGDAMKTQFARCFPVTKPRSSTGLATSFESGIVEALSAGVGGAAR
jgi:hypothetical protein